MRRRDFTLAALSAGLMLPGLARAASDRGYSREKYSKGVVVDGLGSPGMFDPAAAPDAPLSDAALADVRMSGITAINVTVGGVGNGLGKFEEAIRSIAYYEREIAQHADVLMQVRTARDLQVAKQSGRLGLIYGFQDTSMLEGELSRLATFDDLGVRVVQPVYNRRNLMGDGCLEPADGGLSELGRELIAELNRRRILVDLSHASPRTIADGIAACRTPMAITHTGCRALVDVPRNVHDGQLRALAERGGVAGLYFMPFLRVAGQPKAEDLIRHLEHAVNVCGEDHVGLGTDGYISGTRLDAAYAQFQRSFYENRKRAGVAAPGEAADVFNLIADYNEPRRFLRLADDLHRRGWPEARIEKILGANFQRLFRDVWL